MVYHDAKNSPAMSKDKKEIAIFCFLGQTDTHTDRKSQRLSVIVLLAKSGIRHQLFCGLRQGGQNISCGFKPHKYPSPNTSHGSVSQFTMYEPMCDTDCQQTTAICTVVGLPCTALRVLVRTVSVSRRQLSRTTFCLN